MILNIPDLLSPAQTARLAAIAASARFVDGRISNPHSRVKNNLHPDPQDARFGEASQLVAAALHASEAFRLYSFSRRFAAPAVTKHRPGMAYGAHYDAAFMPVSQRPLRSDLSCTVFISDPAGYQGGELTLHLGDGDMAFKGPPGSAVVYPSTTLHEVRPVTSGERVVVITFIESRVANPLHRELLYNLNEVQALEGLGMSWEGRTRLNGVYFNLERLWCDPA